jgi:hypothetical protein
MLHIGIVSYEHQAGNGAQNRVSVACYICDRAFPLQAIAGVVADAAYLFLGNVCPHCLSQPEARIRVALRGTATARHAEAARLSSDPDSVVVAHRLTEEASERERYADGPIYLPPPQALSKSGKQGAGWEWYPMLKGSTAMRYRAWFAVPAVIEMPIADS